jgi:hypothetical protein
LLLKPKKVKIKKGLSWEEFEEEWENTREKLESRIKSGGFSEKKEWEMQIQWVYENLA